MKLTLFVFASIALLAQEALCQKPLATVILPGYRSPVRLDTVGTAIEIAADAPALMGAVRDAYRKLSIAPESFDSTAAGGYVGNLTMKVQRRFNELPVSRFIECGTGQSGPIANSYRVHLAVLTWWTPVAPSRSQLTIAVAAGAQALGGALGDPIACQSTGGIEERLTRIIQEQLAAK